MERQTKIALGNPKPSFLAKKIKNHVAFWKGIQLFNKIACPDKLLVIVFSQMDQAIINRKAKSASEM
ncbi:hypothetical protein [Nitrosopumilus sp.]|uniref:hypothetical protein n=1 Tax=Nitrosopumilus sp. TaxID=2024843 RepID=UPI00292D3368|nr:hypothetical protein [Nitrosopumilus sp.]